MSKLSDTNLYDLEFVLSTLIQEERDFLGIGPDRLMDVYRNLIPDFARVQASLDGNSADPDAKRYYTLALKARADRKFAVLMRSKLCRQAMREQS